jgi:hypothetical protein
MKNKFLKTWLISTAVVLFYVYLQFSIVNKNIDFTKWHDQSISLLAILNCAIPIFVLLIVMFFIETKD